MDIFITFTRFPRLGRRDLYLRGIRKRAAGALGVIFSEGGRVGRTHVEVFTSVEQCRLPSAHHPV